MKFVVCIDIVSSFYRLLVNFVYRLKVLTNSHNAEFTVTLIPKKLCVIAYCDF